MVGSEYPSRECGNCPHLATFQPIENKTGRPDISFIENNTVPKPQVRFQDTTNLTENNLGVGSSNLKPDLAVSPVSKLKNSQQKTVAGKSPQALKSNKGGFPPCNETVKKERLFTKDGYEVKEGGDKIPCECEETQEPKPLLKHQLHDQMHANAGRLPPNQTDPATVAPVPNDLRPVPGDQGKALCYMPQPQDLMPQPVNLEMGPVGPWATGRLDWGPLSGHTGTRPVVDKYSISRYSEGDWRHHNKEIIDESNIEQHRAQLTDWNGRQCLEQTQSDTDKNQADNTKRLNQRELEVHRWKCELERAIAAASEEIGFMKEQRKRLKQAEAVLTIPESISGECLTLRSSRIDGELVRDEVEEELIREVALCAEIRDIFNRTLGDVEKQLLEDKTAKQKLEYDWGDKKVAHEIDSISMALNNRSTVLCFKPGAVCFPEEQSTPEYWEHFTRENLLEGEATRQRSSTLRGTLDAILNNAARDLRSQADRVELALSRRIACVEEVTIRLERELREVLRKLADTENLIGELQAAIRRMDTPMKKAQTRLDNRHQRPKVENCRDAPHFGLIAEVKSIGESVSALHAQLKQAQMCRDKLMKARGDLEREIMLKRKSLEIDNYRIKRIRSFYPSATALSGYS